MYFNVKEADESNEDYKTGIYDNLPNNEFNHPFSTEFNLLEGTEEVLSIVKGLLRDKFLS